ncbi:hypothetical protein EG327_007665 [Venturia inaequalis]|uniref:Uncharacterized protein n=1 Tax=Venturia inaequalis TaxID=5025 RepID=A0A8H3YXP2_VENIN|nr:hypothetical protein EG327_007665 [Venturia inaequalis]
MQNHQSTATPSRTSSTSTTSRPRSDDDAIPPTTNSSTAALAENAGAIPMQPIGVALTLITPATVIPAGPVTWRTQLRRDLWTVFLWGLLLAAVGWMIWGIVRMVLDSRA